MGRATTIQYPDGRKTVYEYDAEGRRTDETQYASGGGGSQNTHTDYDALGRAVTVTYADGRYTSTAYDGQGRVTDSYDEKTNHTHYDYDQAGRRTAMIAGVGNGPQETDYAYDANGNQTGVTVAGVWQFTTGYDSLNRPATVTYPQPANEPPIQPMITTYDNDGRKLSQNDLAGEITQYTYDQQGRLLTVTLAYGTASSQTETYTYDQSGNLLSETDNKGNKTTYTYDKMNRRTSRTLPGKQSESYGPYDATGNLTAKTTFNNSTIGYTYDPLTDRPVSVIFPEGSTSFSYDGFLRRQGMTDVRGAVTLTTTYNYDERNRMTAKNSPYGTITYSYDKHGNLNFMQSSNANGSAVSYLYDALNRPSTVIDQHRWPYLTTTYSYDPFGNLATVTKPNGETVTYAYDVLNRLNSMAATVGGNTIASYTYILGPAGNRAHVLEANNRAVSWTYDDLYRLTGEIINNDPVTANIGAISYGYDPVGNRTNRTSGITAISSQPSLTYDADDRLTNIGYTYDANGSTTSDPNGTYIYDSLGRMTSATVGNNTTTYVYDGDGNKVSQTVSGVATNYLIDSKNLTGYAQVLEEIQGNGVNKVYTYGTSRISEDQFDGTNWNLSFYGYDGQGSVRYLTDVNGNITDRMDYDAFGILINRIGTTPNEFFYDAEYRDADTGLIYLRARWMNPAEGRFVSMDNYEGDPTDPLSLHKYLFTGNDPVNKIDPSGYQYGTIAYVGAAIALFSNIFTGTVYAASLEPQVPFRMVREDIQFETAKAQISGITLETVWYVSPNPFNITVLDKKGNSIPKIAVTEDVTSFQGGDFAFPFLPSGHRSATTNSNGMFIDVWRIPFLGSVPKNTYVSVCQKFTVGGPTGKKGTNVVIFRSTGFFDSYSIVGTDGLNGVRLN